MQEELLKEFRFKLLGSGETVSDIEYTSGNYDNRGNLINEKIPTITTEMCEIGLIGKECYFTVIIESKNFDRNLFKVIQKFKNIQVYGFRSFFENYYPSTEITFEEVCKNINKEKYFQVQFDFKTNDTDINQLMKDYFNIKNLLIGIAVLNQLNVTIE